MNLLKLDKKFKQFRSLFNSQGTIGVQCSVVGLKKQLIVDNYQADYYLDFTNRGGKYLPKEVVNMALRNLNSVSDVEIKHCSIKHAIFSQYMEQLSAVGISKFNHRFHLANIALQYEFGETVSLAKWLKLRLLDVIY